MAPMIGCRRVAIRRLRRGSAVLAVGLGWGLLTAPATAQQQYELQDDRSWKQLTAFEPNTPEGRLQGIRRMVAQEKGKQAQKAATAWIKEHPNHELLAEAYLLRADAMVVRRNYYKSLYDYEHLARQYPESEQFFIALERELAIAKLFAAGMRRKLWGMRIIGAGGEAEELFIRVQERAPGSQLGEEASLALGDYYFGRAEMDSAAEAYDLFLINYPRSTRRERAMLQLIRANLATFKGPRFDASGLIEAAERLKVYQNEFPAAAEQLGADALLVRIEESLALKALFTGRWYEKRGDRVSA
ncbi:MAG: outer membrane protein assembly factor BamD, partial [Planctomycetota bacterium]|nr:outer membrane protein assembly factor BamD [Planctomycetota bacterium]